MHKSVEYLETSAPDMAIMTHTLKKISVVILLVIATAFQAFANPTQTGVTGLISVPTADTLDSGNICVGVWGNLGKNADTDFGIMPATLTLGVGTFWEIYGTYPNLLFNTQEDYSGRGTADVGTKIRFYGKRNSALKIAGDVFVQKHVSENLNINGTNDIGGRLIASLKQDTLGLHLNGGYFAAAYTGEKDYIYGGGIDYLLVPKAKLTFEITGRGTAPVEALVGLQYYLSPHLTFNLAGGAGITAGSPEWRAIIGFSSCQGVGNYIKVIPTIASEEEKNKKREVLKPVKVIPISSLIKTALPVVPVSKLEVPVDPDKEEIVIRPFGQIIIPPQPVAPPVVLPLMTREPREIPKEVVEQIKELPKEVKPVEPVITRLQNEIPVEPKKEAPANLNPVEESSEQGVSPLYGIEIRGDSLEISTAKATKISAKMLVYRKFRFPDIMFAFGQAELSEEVKKSLSEVAEQARTDKNWTFMRIDGHTDSIGSAGYNMDLSVKRAIAIASYLIIKEGIDPSRVFVKGLGKSKLLADNTTTEGRRINRRFEILFLVPKGNR